MNIKKAEEIKNRVDWYCNKGVDFWVAVEKVRAEMDKEENMTQKDLINKSLMEQDIHTVEEME